MIMLKPEAVPQVRAGRRLAQPQMACWVALLLALSAALALSVQAAGAGILTGDLTVTRLVQSVPKTGIDDVTRLVNALGTTLGLMTVGITVIVVLAARNRSGPALFVLVALLAREANLVLKALFESPRPSPDLVRVTEHNAFWGFPSGHTMGVVLVYGAIIWIAPALATPRGWRLTLQLIALGVILMTGFSRIYVGAHWPSDVLGAYLWGGLLFGTLALWYRRVTTSAFIGTSGESQEVWDQA